MTSRKEDSSFDIGQWCDYVRGLLDANTEAQMRMHLESSTKDRLQTMALQRVADLAEFDRTQAPPAWAVRSVKALGSLSRGEETARPSLLQRLVMSLSFDSLASPALVGTRDAQAHDRQMVFTAGSYRVDLRIEPEADFQSAVLVGQLMKTDGELVPLVDIPVLARKAGRVVGHAKSGPFGEFQAAGLPASGVDLCLLLEDDVCLEIELGNNGADGNHPGESA